MGKAPAFQFYPNDWMRDLEEHPLEIEGAWIRLCCKLWWSDTRGKLKKTLHQWSKVLRESENKTKEILDYLEKEKIGDILRSQQENNTYITIICRRMERDTKLRENNKFRQQRFREKGGGDPDRWTAIRIAILKRDDYMCAYCGKKANTVDHVIPRSKGGTEDDFNLVSCCKSCNQIKNNRTLKEAEFKFWKGFDQKKLQNNTKITHPSSSSSSSSNIKYTLSFEQNFWTHYPRKVGKKKAFLEWKKIPDIEELSKSFPKIIFKQKNHKNLLKQKGEFVPEWPDPERWLKYARWEDEIPIHTESETPTQDEKKVCVECGLPKNQVYEDGICHDCYHDPNKATHGVEGLINKAIGKEM